jgi:hypothetical protein
MCTAVILSEVMDLMPGASGDEVLRGAQDDGEKIAHDTISSATLPPDDSKMLSAKLFYLCWELRSKKTNATDTRSRSSSFGSW